MNGTINKGTLVKGDGGGAGGGGGGKCTLQVQVSYDNEVLGNCSVVVDNTTIVTKSNGLATFTGLTKGEKVIEATKSGFLVATDTKQVANSFDFTDIEMTPLTITFTIKDDQNQALVGATVNFNNESKQTDSNGQVVFSQVGIGTKPYTVIMLGYTTLEGTITVEYENQVIDVIMTSALIVGKSTGSYSVGDTVKLNAGVGENNYDFTAYPSDTAQTNDLTVDGQVAEVKTDSIVLTEEPQIENAEITIEVDQDNADIEFNNGNDICTVNIVANMPETHNYLAFKRQSDNSIIYFKDRTYPFVPSDNTYPEITFTYYTYENNEMISHTATTQSQTAGDTIYDGETLIIHSATAAVNGTWLRDTEQDQTINVEYEGATITTSSYLTTPEAIIPTTNNSKFAMEKSNDYDVILVVGGAFTTLANLQEIIIPNNTIIDTYMTLKDGQPAKLLKNTYFKRYTITNDYTLRKVKLSLIINVSAKVTFTINGISKIIENTQLAQIDVYAGETINYTVEAEGYTTQSSSYNCPQYPTVKENIVNITLS